MEEPQETYRPQLDIEDITNPDITEAVRNSPILAILVEEVRVEKEDGNPNAYNRMHNRHNRSGPRGPWPRPPQPEPEPPKPEPEGR